MILVLCVNFECSVYFCICMGYIYIQYVLSLMKKKTPGTIAASLQKLLGFLINLNYHSGGHTFLSIDQFPSCMLMCCTLGQRQQID